MARRREVRGKKKNQEAGKYIQQSQSNKVVVARDGHDICGRASAAIEPPSMTRIGEEKSRKTRREERKRVEEKKRRRREIERDRERGIERECVKRRKVTSIDQSFLDYYFIFLISSKSQSIYLFFSSQPLLRTGKGTNTVGRVARCRTARTSVGPGVDNSARVLHLSSGLAEFSVFLPGSLALVIAFLGALCLSFFCSLAMKISSGSVPEDSPGSAIRNVAEKGRRRIPRG